MTAEPEQQAPPALVITSRELEALRRRLALCRRAIEVLEGTGLETLAQVRLEEQRLADATAEVAVPCFLCPAEIVATFPVDDPTNGVPRAAICGKCERQPDQGDGSRCPDCTTSLTDGGCETCGYRP